MEEQISSSETELSEKISETIHKILVSKHATNKLTKTIKLSILSISPDLQSHIFGFHQRNWFKDISNYSKEVFQQFLIDATLQVAANIIHGKKGLIEQQDDERKSFEKVINSDDEIPRNLMRVYMEKEEGFKKEIKEYKTLFNSLLFLAEELGYEVFRREANQYKLYCRLSVSVRHIHDDLVLRGKISRDQY